MARKHSGPTIAKNLVHVRPQDVIIFHHPSGQEFQVAWLVLMVPVPTPEGLLLDYGLAGGQRCRITGMRPDPLQAVLIAAAKFRNEEIMAAMSKIEQHGVIIPERLRKTPAEAGLEALDAQEAAPTDD